ncbi:MAG TPA: DEAD/DEAH box helicase [Ktedonobacterales bacterium]|nr:DEAD/DEAH box helicase [Ktedonobacterales bacterium]
MEARVSGSERERQRRHGERRVETPPSVFWKPRGDARALALVESSTADQPYPLNDLQREATRREAAPRLAEGRPLLAAAPTGTGKTVVAEAGIWLARREDLRANYTMPVKALSNQKYRDLRARSGAGDVGLLTRDIVENPNARIVAMTTEVYRNMLLEGLRHARLAGAPWLWRWRLSRVATQRCLPLIVCHRSHALPRFKARPVPRCSSPCSAMPMVA